MVKLSPEFYKKLLMVSNNVGMKPEHILQVMASESGLNPQAHNSTGDATGLIQFMPNTLKGLGFKGTYQDFKNIPDYKQLDYVEKLIKAITKFNGGPLKSAAQYYVGNFIPAALAIPGVKEENPRTIICSRNPTTPHIPGVSLQREAHFYSVNQGLDHNKDGNITYGDMQSAVARAAAGKNYQMALNDLSTNTNYKPTRSLNTPQFAANKKPQGIFDMLEGFLHQIMASEKSNKQIYKKYLPYNNAVIKINAGNYINSVEFARVCTQALEEELLSKAYIHTNGKEVEIETSIPGPSEESFKAAEQLVTSLAEVFYDATKKIGSISVKTEFISNKKSSYQPISIKSAEMQHRKFLLKFA